MPSPVHKTDQSEAISIRVLLFSVLRERLDASEIEVSLARGGNTTDLLRMLMQTYPDIRSYASVTRLAVNEDYVDDPVELTDGDEVALITPVSGG